MLQTVLVTGATGYVGREVVDLLLAKGKEVTALGRTVPDADVAFIEADLTDAEGLAAALEGRSFDAIASSTSSTSISTVRFWASTSST